ncbi:hypothetical protein LMG28727_07047 [Paraburkholderia kirstenboschensis]|nr:hypothetical protein LMG28727_07047 [Paraburkholderia kirstenboschensis]
MKLARSLNAFASGDCSSETGAFVEGFANDCLPGVSGPTGAGAQTSARAETRRWCPRLRRRSSAFVKICVRASRVNAPPVGFGVLRAP